MPLLPIQQRIVDRAITLKGIPYVERGWSLKGFDCIGSVYYVGHEEDALYFYDGCPEGVKWRNYSPIPDVPLMSEALETFLVKLPDKNVYMPGDILWFRDPRAQHLGIVTHVSPYTVVVHASQPTGKVEHERVRKNFMIYRAFRYPKVQEAMEA